MAFKIRIKKLECFKRELCPWIKLSTRVNKGKKRIRSQNQYKMTGRKITTNFVISVDHHKRKNLQIKRSLRVTRNLPINLGNASTVVSKRSMLSRLIVQQTDRNVEFVRK